MLVSAGGSAVVELRVELRNAQTRNVWCVDVTGEATSITKLSHWLFDSHKSDIKITPLIFQNKILKNKLSLSWWICMHMTSFTSFNHVFVFPHTSCSSAVVTVRLPTVRRNLGIFRNATVCVERHLTRGFSLIKLVPQPRLWEMVHLLFKVARNPPQLFIWPPSKEVVWENAFIFHNPSTLPPNLSIFHEELWRYEIVWN